MKICDNGNVREMTPKEVEEIQKAEKEWEEEMKNRPPTNEELLQAQIDELKKTIISMSAET